MVYATRRKTNYADLSSKLLERERTNEMKTFFWVAGAVCGAMAGVMIWSRRRNEPVEELAHRLESAWADHHTVA